MKKRTFVLALILSMVLVLFTFSPVASAGKKVISLPTDPVDYVLTIPGPGAQSFFTVDLSNVGSGYDVEDGPYAGWCADLFSPTSQNVSYSGELYSSLNNKLPKVLNAIESDKVNWILNNWSSVEPTAGYYEVQAAIWYFTNPTTIPFKGFNPDPGFGSLVDPDPVVVSIIDAALANGNGFTPAPGQVVAVYIYDSSLALNFPGNNWATYVTYEVGSGEQIVSLVAGQSITVGQIVINQVGNDLIVTYQTDGPWRIVEAHAHVADTLADIPQTNSGNPIPGHFDQGGQYDYVTSAQFTFDISGAEAGETLFLALHAVVCMSLGMDSNQIEQFQCETAWGTFANQPVFIEVDP